jgi:hypothetical protein
MGFGFNFAFILIVLPLSAVLLVLWFISGGNKFYSKALGVLWLGVIGLVILSATVNAITSKVVLEKEDFYGEYVIDRSYFSGKQADWQYNHFRFQITPEDSIHFHVTEGEKIIRSYKGHVHALEKNHKSARLAIYMDNPTHHIMLGQPTIYRNAWGFTLVFLSPYYHNMYFTQDDWKTLD